MSRPRIALLSNPKSTGNIAQLSRIRDYCADHPDIFHYEVERAEQIGDALRTIARVRPKMLIINGGDGTVQAALTEIHNGGHFVDGAAARGRPSERQDEPHRARSGRAGRPDRGAREIGGARSVGFDDAHRRAGTDRASERAGFAAGDRHVPWRRRARRHDALLPRQDLSARSPERRQPCADRGCLACPDVPSAPVAIPSTDAPPLAGFGPARRFDLGPLRLAGGHDARKDAAVGRSEGKRARAAQVARRSRSGRCRCSRRSAASLAGKLGASQVPGRAFRRSRTRSASRARAPTSFSMARCSVRRSAGRSS